MSGMVGGGEMDSRRRMEMEQRRNADLFASVSRYLSYHKYVHVYVYD